jgi:hypothetical protein
MRLIQVIFNLFTMLPITIVNRLATNSTFTDDPSVEAKIQFAYAIVNVLFYIYFAISS